MRRRTLCFGCAIILAAAWWCSAETKVREDTYRGRPFSKEPIFLKGFYDGKIPTGWRPAEQKSVVLENEFILVEILPERQGRIFRMVDKATGIDLINVDALFDHFPHNNWHYLKDRLPINRANRLGIVTQAVGLSYGWNPEWQKTKAAAGEGVELVWKKEEVPYVVRHRLSLESNALRLDWSCTNEGEEALRNVIPVVRPEIIPFHNFSNDPKLLPAVLFPDTTEGTVHRLVLDEGGYLHAESTGAAWAAMVDPRPARNALVMNWSPAVGTKIYRYRASWWVNQCMAVFTAEDIEPKTTRVVTWWIRPVGRWRLDRTRKALSEQMPEADVKQLVDALANELARPERSAAELIGDPAARVPQPLGHGQKPSMTFAFMGGAGLMGGERTEPYNNVMGEIHLEAAVSQLNLLKPDTVFLAGPLTEAGNMDEHKQLAGVLEKLQPPVQMAYPSEREAGRFPKVKDFAFVRDGIGFLACPNREAWESRAKNLSKKGAKELVLFMSEIPATRSQTALVPFPKWYAEHNVTLVLGLNGSADKFYRAGKTTVIAVQSLNARNSLDGSYAFCSVYGNRIEVQMRVRGFTSMPTQVQLQDQNFYFAVVPRASNASAGTSAQVVDELPAWLGDPEFTFAVVGDPQVDYVRKKREDVLFSYGTYDYSSLPHFADELGHITAHRPEVLVVPGDLTNYNNPIEWEWLMRHLRQLRDMKLFLVPGNHDWVRRPEGVEEFYGLFEKHTGQKAYQVLDHKLARFVGFAYSEKGQKESPAFASRTMAEKEFAFVENALRSSPKEYSFLLNHFQICEWAEQWSRISEMLTQHKVSAWFAGHRHTNLNHPISRSGTIEVIFPGLVKNYGGLQCGYYLVHVYPDKLVYRFKPMATSGTYAEGPFKGLLKPAPNPITVSYIWRPKE